MRLAWWRNVTGQYDRATRIPLIGHHLACAMHDIHIRICQAELRKHRGRP